MRVEKQRVSRLEVTALLSVRALTAAASMGELVLAIVTQAAVVELGIPQMQCTIRCFESTHARASYHPILLPSYCPVEILLRCGALLTVSSQLYGRLLCSLRFTGLIRHPSTSSHISGDTLVRLYSGRTLHRLCDLDHYSSLVICSDSIQHCDLAIPRL